MRGGRAERQPGPGRRRINLERDIPFRQSSPKLTLTAVQPTAWPPVPVSTWTAAGAGAGRDHAPRRSLSSSPDRRRLNAIQRTTGPLGQAAGMTGSSRSGHCDLVRGDRRRGSATPVVMLAKEPCRATSAGGTAAVCDGERRLALRHRRQVVLEDRDDRLAGPEWASAPRRPSLTSRSPRTWSAAVAGHRREGHRPRSRLTERPTIQPFHVLRDRMA